MSDNCPKFNNDVFEQILKIAEETEGLDLTKCDMSGGRKKMKGGALTKKIIRNTIWLLIAILAAYVGVSGNHETIKIGIEMLLSGQCSSFAEAVKSRFYMGNPICTLYTNVLTTIARAITGDAASFTMLIGMITTTLGAPYVAISSVDRLVDAVATTLRIQDVGEIPRIEDTSYRNLGVGERLSLKGGRKQKNKKQKTRSKKTKRHTKRHTKNRKIRRYTKKY